MDFTNKTILDVNNLEVIYKVPIKTNASIFKKLQPLYAINNVSFQLSSGKTLGIVGESGSGKSTLGKAILRLLDDAKIKGNVDFNSVDLLNLKVKDLKKIRKYLQIIFQDPLASLNPKMIVKDIISEPLKVFYPNLKSREIDQKVYDVMDQVGLVKESAYRYAHEFSGGQAQRIGIARAMILSPKLLICDEAVSALDVSIKAQIINLLQDLQKVYNLSIIFISHDLSVVKYISDEILVLYLGSLMEIGSSEDLYKTPTHPYTEALISAIPDIYQQGNNKHIILKGDIPSPLNLPKGCPFSSRCIYAKDLCFTEKPTIKEHRPNQFSACFFPLNTNN